MRQFKADIEGAFAQPLTLNIYDTEFYSQIDGSLDFGRTSSCFQVLKDEDSVNLDKVQNIFAADNPRLKSLLEKYNVDSVERCARYHLTICIHKVWLIFQGSDSTKS